METEPDGAHETAVFEDDLRGWNEALKRFVTGLELAALGQGERIDPGQLLADFKEAQGRLLPRLLAARGQPLPPDSAGEQEAHETPVIILPTKLFDRLVEARGLIKIIDDAAVREGQGQRSDPDQLLTELTAALFKDEEEEDGASPSDAAASPAMPTSMFSGSAHSPTKPYRCRMIRKGRTEVFCCETIHASSDLDADTQLTDLLLRLSRRFKPTADSPKKNKECTGKDEESPCNG